MKKRGLENTVIVTIILVLIGCVLAFMLIRNVACGLGIWPFGC